MIAEPHKKALKEENSNKGSCQKYIHYLMKYNASLFSDNRNDISEEEAIKMIDKHIGSGVGKNDDKWYAPIYSLSEEESQFLAFKLFGKRYTDYQELNEEEKLIWNQKLIEIGRAMQDEMAKNFNRSELGINSGADLMYVGVVENERYYQGDDDEVKKGKAKSGERKKGFNTHIHIVQSRRANNAKKSKISPLANERKVRENNLGKKVGFDRGQFKINCDKKFDEITGYKRKIEESFEYRNEVKKDTGEDKERIKKRLRKTVNDIGIKIDRRKKNIYSQNKYVSKKEIAEIKKVFPTLDYFFELQEKGLLIYEGQKEGKHIFREYYKESPSISLNEAGYWYDWENKEKGSVIEAVIKFERYKNWLEAALYLKGEMNHFKSVEQEAKNEKKKVLDEGKVVFKNYTEYYEKAYGIPPDLVKRHLSQVRYELPNGKVCYGIGMKNQSGGYELTNGKFVSNVGKQDITTLTYDNENKNLLIFNYTEDYLQYLAKQGVDRTREDVIILNGENQLEKAKELLKDKNYEKVVYITDNQIFDPKELSLNSYLLSLEKISSIQQQKR
ncbi:DUF5712 family protein [Capnocytophaga sputigena]|uniref:DUF5712 family protein n=1 Tax=Capnocytophaga sputigena TaxID=1019 RepID=UPI0028D78A25|nr:DUF5712 family protein [Capnocytophaga sputigena]